jgi:aspartyl-tRNA(Asn)/glutamyl-tRNA(Gln) amidotransferase subunit B
MSPDSLAEIVALLDKGTISGNISKKLFEEVLESGKKPSAIVEEKGMSQNSDEGELEKIVQKIIDANPDETERFRAGDKKLQGFFMGQIMRESKGKANPGVVSQLLNKLIN